MVDTNFIGKHPSSEEIAAAGLRNGDFIRDGELLDFDGKDSLRKQALGIIKYTEESVRPANGNNLNAVPLWKKVSGARVESVLGELRLRHDEDDISKEEMGKSQLHEPSASETTDWISAMFERQKQNDNRAN